MTQFISATEKIYLELSRPAPPQAKPASATTDVKPITLTRADVDLIIQRKRCSSPAELQYVIDHAKALMLTPGERNQIGCDLSILMTQRARNMSGRRENPATEFLSKVMGLVETPHGLVPRSFIADDLRAGAANIPRCRLHRPQFCECWSAQRAILWQAIAQGEKSPEGWAASRAFSALEDLELSSRPEHGPKI
jgi:hypothetical protein